MLYTNNSIMTIARSTTAYQGQININGGVVAADVGMLVPGLKDKSAGTQTRGLTLNYDTRQKAAFSLRASDNKITFTRALRY